MNAQLFETNRALFRTGLRKKDQYGSRYVFVCVCASRLVTIFPKPDLSGHWKDAVSKHELGTDQNDQNLWPLAAINVVNPT